MSSPSAQAPRHGVYLLPLRVDPKPRETLPSFFSRVAAANGCGPAQFALEMGFSLKRILNLEPWTLQRFFQLSGLERTQADELVSWTGINVGNVRTELRNEVFVSRAVRSPTVRGCPACLREDAAGEASPMLSMYLRGEWQIRGNNVCLRHDLTLVPLWTHATTVARYSVFDRLFENLDKILSGSHDGAPMRPSEYDWWLYHRLQNRSDQTWFRAIGLYPAVTFCELLGTELLRVGAVTTTTKNRPSVIGFLAANAGPKKIEEALSKLLSHAKEAALEPRGVYGSLFTYLDRASRDDPAFDQLRTLLRSHIFQHWPLAPGTEIFGQSLTSRKIHSIATASREIGIGQALLDDLLTEAGALDPKDKRGPRQKTFELAPFAQLLTDIPSWVGPNEMQNAIGATKTELRTLMEDKILSPRSKLPKVKSPWSVADGRALLDHLKSFTQRRVSASEAGWMTLQAARTHSKLTLSKILNSIETGKLTIGQVEGREGYHSFVVAKEELAPLLGHEAEPDLVPAAAFGREIGLRGKDSFLKFVSDGHTPAQTAPHPVTGHTFLYMSPEDIAAFRRKFVTPSMLAVETGAYRNTIVAALASHHVPRHMPGGTDYGPIYLREAAQPALSDLLTS